MSLPSMPMGARERRAGWLDSSRRLGLYSARRAEDDVLLDVVLPATHRLARQLGAKVVAAAQGPWPDHFALLARDLQGAQG